MYDKDDGFIDDSEMAWEEQAAAVKDGFFVYSGPLVPPGGKAEVEKYAFPFIFREIHVLIQVAGSQHPRRSLDLPRVRPQLPRSLRRHQLPARRTKRRILRLRMV